MTSLLAENFETGNFQMFNWEMEGQEAWTLTEDVVYEGNYSAGQALLATISST